MPFNRRATLTAVAALSLGAAGPIALAAQTAPSTPAPAPAQEGLLDPIVGVIGGLTDTLDTLLSAAALSDLTNLTSTLNGGGDASSDALAPVTSLLDSLALADPANAPALSAVAALTQTGSDGPIATPFLEPVAALLGQLATVDGLTSGQALALTDLQSALEAVIAGGLPTDAVAGLPLDDLPLDPAQLSALTDLLADLQGGTASSPELLAPIAALLSTVAGTSGLPAPVAEVINAVADQLASATSLDGDLLTKVGQLLNAVAATPGVSPEDRDLLATLTGLLGSVGVTPPTVTTPTVTTPTVTIPTTTTPTTTTPTTTTTTTTTPTTTAPGAATLPAGTSKPGTTTTTTTTGAGAGAGARVPARLKRARYDRKRGSLVLTLSCPTGTARCGSIVYAMIGSRSVVKPRVVMLSDGQVAERRLKLDSKSRRSLKKRALRLNVYAVTSRTQIASRSLKIARAPKAKRKR